MAPGDQPHSINSPRDLSRRQAREEGASSTDAPSNYYDSFGRHGPVHSKLSDELRKYLADQPRLVLIGVNGVASPFFHLPFHAQPDSQQEKHQHVAR